MIKRGEKKNREEEEKNERKKYLRIRVEAAVTMDWDEGIDVGSRAIG